MTLPTSLIAAMKSPAETPKPTDMLAMSWYRMEKLNLADGLVLDLSSVAALPRQHEDTEANQNGALA